MARKSRRAALWEAESDPGDEGGEEKEDDEKPPIVKIHRQISV